MSGEGPAEDGPDFVRTSTNGITLNVARAGPVDGPLVVLLHGFPESSHGWRHQVGPLARAGYRVLAPDQRGYATSDKPRGVAAYALDVLVEDVVGLVDEAGRSRATVIGHDWGGIVAWAAIARHPSRFDRAVILNAPHPDAMLGQLKGDLGQLCRSWYALGFQVPRLPEILLRRRDFRTLAGSMARSGRPGTFSAADLEHHKREWAGPGALTSMLHWYRAGLRCPHAPFPDPLIRVPTLMIWGTGDRFLGPGVARSSFALCESARLEWIDEATHWVHHEEPDRVNRLILDFLGSSP